MNPHDTLDLAKQRQEELRHETSHPEAEAGIVSSRLRHRAALALRGLAERLEPRVYRKSHPYLWEGARESAR